MPEFWQFPTVSMGLGPIMAIYQARFMRYLQDRGIADTDAASVWAFLGDGEMDEPESLGAITLAAREKLDNLIFVINCNLQRLDGPVRGNGKIIQELEGDVPRRRLERDQGDLGQRLGPAARARPRAACCVKRMEEARRRRVPEVRRSSDGAYVRKHFFGKYPELLELVANMTDDDIWRLNRGGHDPQQGLRRVQRGRRSTRASRRCILVKTVKGYGMGEAGEGKNTDAPAQEARRRGAPRVPRPLPHPDPRRRARATLPFYKPADDSPEMKYLHERRKALGGYLPQRRVDAPTAAARRRGSTTFEAAARGHRRRPRDLDDDGVRATARPLLRDKDARQARRADHPRRGAHLRHGRPVPPARHLLAAGQLYKPVDDATR